MLWVIVLFSIEHFYFCGVLCKFFSKDRKNQEIKELGKILLETGALLMSSGANTARVRITLNRIANAFGYTIQTLITHRALMLSVSDEEQDYFFSSLRRTVPHGVNFKVVSGISHMSWKVVEQKWDFDMINTELKRLSALPHYPRWLILLLVSFAGASFCRLFGGHFDEMAVAFVATFVGLFVRQEATWLKFNPYLCIFFAALVSSLISGLSVKLSVGGHPDLAFATSVLYLVPGVPLINSFSDLLDGNIMNGIVRGFNGLIISMCIALGLLVAILVYQI
jgi:uncharacterized membrane protein YjjP (DUF1212 family)